MSFDEAAARARCEAATPGPWTVRPEGTNDRRDLGAIDAPSAAVCAFGESQSVDGWGYAPRPYDAVFIANARTDLPAALDVIRRQREELQAIRTAVANARGADLLEEAARIDRTLLRPDEDAFGRVPASEVERTAYIVAERVVEALKASVRRTS